MSPFEFVFFLYAIMISLALTHLVSGWAHAYRDASRIVWSLPFVLWSLAVFLFTTGNLTSFWQMRDATDWNAWLVLSNFSFAITNYVLCVFIAPDARDGEVLDLAEFHEQHRNRYLGTLVVFEILALAFNVVNGMFASYDNWAHDLALSAVVLAAAVIGMVSDKKWIQSVMATIAALVGIQAVIASSAIIGS